LGNAELKVPGGKLVEARVETSEGKIVEILITGDFYMHPEEELEELEENLLGVPVNMVDSVVHRFFDERKVTLVGVKPEHFAKAILMAANR